MRELTEQAEPALLPLGTGYATPAHPTRSCPPSPPCSPLPDRHGTNLLVTSGWQAPGAPRSSAVAGSVRRCRGQNQLDGWRDGILKCASHRHRRILALQNRHPTHTRICQPPPKLLLIASASSKARSFKTFATRASAPDRKGALTAWAAVTLPSHASHVISLKIASFMPTYNNNSHRFPHSLLGAHCHLRWWTGAVLCTSTSSPSLRALSCRERNCEKCRDWWRFPP